MCYTRNVVDSGEFLDRAEAPLSYGKDVKQLEADLDRLLSAMLVNLNGESEAQPRAVTDNR